MLCDIFLMSSVLNSSIKEERQLDDQAQNHSRLNQQINKQRQMDATDQRGLEHRIIRVKQNAAQLTQGLEEERHKHNTLKKLVNYYQHKTKADHDSEQNANSPDNQLSNQSLDHRLRKLKEELHQFTCNTNKVQDGNEDMKKGITQSRKQRVIDSAIFRNLEKELNKTEFAFRQLLIERTKHQRELDILQKNYDQLKKKKNPPKTIQRVPSLNKKGSIQNVKTRVELNESAISSTDTNKFKPLALTKSMKSIRATNTSHNSRKKKSTKYAQNEAEYIKENHILRVRKLMLQTGLTSPEQIIDNCQNLEYANDQTYSTIEELTNESNRLEEECKRMAWQMAKINSKHLKKSRGKQGGWLEGKSALAKIDKEIAKERQAVKKLAENQGFQILLKGLNKDGSQNRPKQPYNAVCNVLKLLEGAINSKKVKAPKRPVSPRLSARQATSRSSGRQKLNDMMRSVTRTEHCQGNNVMKRQQFERQYRDMMLQATLKKKKAAAVGPANRRSNASLRSSYRM